MDVKKIKKCKYNPRLMSKESKKALGKSIENFGDISGIVINKQSGTIVAGNHRWDELIAKHGKANIGLMTLSDEFSMITNKKEPTGFIARFVDWDDAKEKAANIAANSELISGEFTSGLQDLLEEIAPEMYDIFEDLRFDELTIDLEGLDDDTGWADEQIDRIKEEKDNSIHDTDEAPGAVNEVICTLKLTMPGEIKEEFIMELKHFLAKKNYEEVEIRE